jgi:hypothetical protein
MKMDKILKELKSIKVDNAEVLSTIQKTQDMIAQLIIDTNKLTFKIQDLEKDVEELGQS